MSEHITHTPNVKRLERSNSQRVLAGVCAGLGRYFDLNPVVFRLGLVVLTLIGGAGILVYLAAVLVMPAEGRDTSIAEDVLSERRDHPVRLVGLGLVAVALFVLLSQAHTWPAAGAGWVLLLVAGVAILFASRGRRARRFAIAAGTLVVTLLAAAVTAVVVAFTWFDVSLSDGVGERTFQPATTGQVQQPYELGVGHLRIDLTRLQRADDVHVAARLGVGELRVLVPADARIVTTTHVKAGDTTEPADGGAGPSTIHLDLRVGAGHIDIERVSRAG